MNLSPLNIDGSGVIKCPVKPAQRKKMNQTPTNMGYSDVIGPVTG